MKYFVLSSICIILLISCTNTSIRKNHLVGQSYVKRFVGTNWVDTTQIIFITNDYVQVKSWNWIEDNAGKFELAHAWDEAKTLKYKIDGDYVIIEYEKKVKSYVIGNDNLKSEDDELFILKKERPQN